MARGVKNPIVNGKKVCTRCGLRRSVTKFRRKGRTNEELRSKCKECEREIVREWQQSNRERYRGLQKRWDAKNRRDANV